MKVVVVTGLTPTPENRGGISALLYALLRFRPNDVRLKIYSYNFNKLSSEDIKQLEADLKVTIEVVSPTSLFRLFNNSVWLSRFSKFFRMKPIENWLFSHKVINNIQNEKSDFILTYPYNMSSLMTRLSQGNFLISGPDSGILNRARRLNNAFRLNSSKMRLDDYINLRKHIRTEKLWGARNARVHFVGMADLRCYSDVTGNSNGHFLLHPYVKFKEKQIDFSHRKLKVIIPGGYDMYYSTDINKMIPSLLKHKDFLMSHFDFTFLGKQWSPIDNQLRVAGFDCEFKTWVDDYAEELVQHDIMIAPISFGTGTKGKVLDGAVNGLLIVGSEFALENVCVRHQDSCVAYSDASEIASILISIALHREKYQAIAEKGRRQVQKYHDPKRISTRFFNIYYKELCEPKI